MLNNKGFTLFELIVGVGIGIIGSFLILCLIAIFKALIVFIF